MLEARLLTGDAELFRAMQDALTPDKVWPVKAFFEAKKAEQLNRHSKFDDTGYKLEPNVKESPGGLRDIHTIGWVTTRNCGEQTLGELPEGGFLNKHKSEEL